MALSGIFYGKTTNQFVKPRIRWSAQQNILENYSDVTVELTYQGETVEFSPYISLKDGSVQVGDRGIDITKYDGVVFEKSCPSYGNDGQWDAMVQGGDVIGLVVGHDHVNNFIVNCNGIDLIQTPGCTFESYSNGMYQGARVIEIDEKNPTDYDTYILTATKLAMENGSSLVDDEGRTEFDLKLNFYFTKIFEIFYEILLSFFSGNVVE